MLFWFKYKNNTTIYFVSYCIFFNVEYWAVNKSNYKLCKRLFWLLKMFVYVSPNIQCIRIVKLCAFLFPRHCAKKLVYYITDLRSKNLLAHISILFYDVTAAGHTRARLSRIYNFTCSRNLCHHSPSVWMCANKYIYMPVLYRAIIYI